ncbi:MAG: leucyl aminopeptidase family protein [Alphaproteobacteria bacterium]|nr:leucyl aminopeptidase family protein [Alphaproteobacteria bacterium]
MRPGDFTTWSQGEGRAAAWARRLGFEADAGKTCLVPGLDGDLAEVLLGLGTNPDLWTFAGLSRSLPAGSYFFAPEPAAPLAEQAAIGWAIGAYAFGRYKEIAGGVAQLVLPPAVRRGRVETIAEGIALARDLINTPASDMGPAELTEVAGAVAARHGAQLRSLVGEALLEANYPAIHAVGRASTRAPRLIDLRWGDEAAPRVTLVGKGVCFDTGGLDLKPSSGMLLMKKDMGGAAYVIALADMIMRRELKLRLRVLVPAVENAVAGNALRPLDVIRTRKGLTVEIGNTDAEGRVILCDALAEAASEKPELLIDFATLTGAARVALGPDLPALFTDDDALAADLARHGLALADPVWRMPLFRPYRELLKSEVADLNNVSEGSHAGAITAALYLSEFVAGAGAWAHFDIMAWNPKARPGRPKGGEAMGLRAVFALLAERYGG